MAYRHGVYVEELPTSLVAPIEGTSGLQVVFGTAPINLASDPYSVTNNLQIAYSYAEAAKKLGYSNDFKKYSLCQSVDATFRVFNVAPIILVNVLDPKKHVKENEEKAYSVIKGKAIINIEGILKDTLVVKSIVETTDEDMEANEPIEYIQNQDYVATFDDDGYIVLAFLDNSIKTVNISSISIAPEMVTKYDIIGGVDINTGQETGFELVRWVYPKLGMTPGLILAPGWSHMPEVAAVISAKCENINGAFRCEALLDIDTTLATTYDKVKEIKEKTGISDPHSIACWPKAAIGEKQYYYSAILAAQTAYLDASNDDVPVKYPSNKNANITATVLEDGTEIYLDQEQGNMINSFGVCTAINMNGFKSWGVETAAYPSTTDPKDRFIGVRRMTSWHANTFILTYIQKVDDPLDFRLIESVIDSENIRCNSLQARNKWAGGRIEYKAEENGITDILDGKVVFHQYIAPYVPAKEIHNMVEFDPEMLRADLMQAAS